MYEFVGDCPKGDFNHDGISDVLDIVGVTNYIIGYMSLTDFQRCSSDINNDSYIDILDIVMLLNIILEDEWE